MAQHRRRRRNTSEATIRQAAGTRALISAILRLSAACSGSGIAAARASAIAPARSDRARTPSKVGLASAVDDRVPVRKPLAVGLAMALDHGRGLDDRRCRLRLPGQAAVDHVQPALDPDPLPGIAHRVQPPPPQSGLDLQAADAKAGAGREADRHARLAHPAYPFQRIQHRLGDHGRQRLDQFVEPEFYHLGRSGLRAALRQARPVSVARSGSDPGTPCARPSAARCRRAWPH